jgi:CheY-like chemotaxis protein
MEAAQHILYVENEPELMKMFSMFLEPLYNVTTFRTADEGLEFLKTNKVDLILSDFLTPGNTNGAFFLRLDIDTPVIILTGYPLELELKSNQLILFKPTMPLALLDIIASMLNTSSVTPNIPPVDL